MAYKHSQPPYYGDEEPQVGPYAPREKQSGYVPGGSGGGGGGGGGVSPDITEIDFNKVRAKNAPWLERRKLSQAMDTVSPSQSTTLSGANKRVEEIVKGLKQCASS